MRSLHALLITSLFSFLVAFKFGLGGVRESEWVIFNLSYPLTCFFFAAWVLFFWQKIQAKKSSLKPQVGAIFILFLGVIWIHWCEPHILKVSQDEQSHLSLAWMMHIDRRVALPLAVHEIIPTPVIGAYFAPFRGHLFSYLTSVLLDIGAPLRAAPFITNALLGLSLIAIVYLMAKKWLRSPALACIPPLLLMSAPIFGQVMCSGSYDLANLTLLALSLKLLLEYSTLQSDTTRRLLLCSAVLLSYCRSESVLYSGIILTVVTWQTRAKPILEICISALGLIPALATQNLLTGNPNNLWQNAQSAGDKLWSINQLLPNLSDSLYHFVLGGKYDMGSPLLFLLGLAGAVRIIRNLCVSPGKAGRDERVVLIFTALALGIYCVPMGSFWGGPSQAVMTRFTLPLWFALSLLSVFTVMELRRFAYLPQSIVAAWFIFHAMPIYAKHHGTNTMHISAQQEEMGRLAEENNDGRTLFVSKSQIPLINRGLCVVEWRFFSSNLDKYAELVRMGAYSRIVLVELVRLRDATGKNFDNEKGVGSLRNACLTTPIASEIVDRGFRISLSQITGVRLEDGILSISPSNDRWPEFDTVESLRLYFSHLYPTGYGRWDIARTQQTTNLSEKNNSAETQSK